MALSKSLDLSEPTFLICPTETRWRPVLQGWAKWTVLDAIDMWTEGSMGAGVEGVIVLGGSMYMSAHVCVLSAHERCVLSRGQVPKDVQFSIYLPRASLHVIHCGPTLHMDRQFSIITHKGQCSGPTLPLHQGSLRPPRDLPSCLAYWLTL